MSSLPPARLATGVAVFSMSRQLGAAIGVAVLVAVLGTPSPPDPVAAFDHAWTVIAVGAVLAAVWAAALGPMRRPAPVPAVAAAGA